MLNKIIENKLKIHTRDIRLATYPHTDSSVIVHGWLTQKRKDKSPVPKDLDSFSEKKFLIDSCRMWARQGAKIKNLEQAIKARQL